MTGQVLYLMYEKFQEEEKCSIDTWSQFGESERNVWNKLAEWISETDGIYV